MTLLPDGEEVGEVDNRFRFQGGLDCRGGTHNLHLAL